MNKILRNSQKIRIVSIAILLLIVGAMVQLPATSKKVQARRMFKDLGRLPGAWFQNSDPSIKTNVKIFIEPGTGWDADQIGAVEAAFVNWENVQGPTGCNCNVDFTFVTTRPTNPDYFIYVNRKVPSVTSWRGEFGNASYASYPHPRPGFYLKNGDINIHPNVTNLTALTKSVAHEIGHSFGLDHCLASSLPCEEDETVMAFWKTSAGMNGTLSGLTTPNITDQGFIKTDFCPVLGSPPTPTPTPTPPTDPPICFYTTDPFCPAGFVSSGGTRQGGTCCEYQTPILIDIENNGFQMTDYYGGVKFDLAGKGAPYQISWTARNSDDAWLVLDRNRNGRIDDGTEMFGDAAEQPGKKIRQRNGFKALAVFDLQVNGGNDDGKITRADAVFGDLRLWQDTNHNGVSERSELSRLRRLGVRSINLKFKRSRKVDEFGNRFRFRSRVADTRKADVGRWAWDIYLVVRPPGQTQ